MKRSYSNLIFILLVVLVLGIFTYNFTGLDRGPGEKNLGELRIHVFDVGQGDSIFIELANDQKLLIDGASRSQAKTVVDNLRELNVEKIDYLVASHPHEDHIGGLPEVIRNFDIGRVYMPDIASSTKIFEELLLEIRDRNIRLEKAEAGFSILEDGDLSIRVISPSRRHRSINNNSLVIKLDYKDFSAIFTGDIEYAGERELVDRGEDLRADLLKVSHHGSKTSTDADFLDRVNPSHAIISLAENNKYGHPDPEIIDRLRARNINIYRTDRDGTIIVGTDGSTMDIIKK